MHSYMLREMAKHIIENADLRDTFAYDRVLEALRQYWQDKAAHVWDVSDVLMECPALSRAEARYVLETVINSVDPDVGINWDVIGRVAERLYPNKVGKGIAETLEYELFYGTGGHGGPYHGFAEAKKAAEGLLRGSRIEHTIHIVPRDGVFFGIEGSVFEVRRTHACTA